MGDGRYYTQDQFYNIMFLTFLLIVVVISLILCLYTVNRYIIQISTIGGLLTISLLCSFVSEIAVGQSQIIHFYYLSKVSLITCIAVYFVFYIQYFMQNGIDKHVVALALLLLLMPTILYIYNQEFLKVVYMLFILNFVIISNRSTKYAVSSSVFSDVKRLILDYVFIIGINGEIIFKSDKAVNSHIFKKVKRIDVNNIGHVFHEEILIRRAFGKQIIKLSGKKTRYFQYNKKEILDNKKRAGHILTLTEITELIAMLDRLKNKQEETANTNKELIRYKDIVYEIEREKEINSLLDEIAENQQKAMLELKDRIVELDISDHGFVEEINELILVTKADLKDVRNAVVAYINYYEEGEYDD